MKLRFGLMVAGSLAIVSTGCAGGGGGGTTAAPSPTPGAETLAQGERPRENQFTREAARAIEEAQQAMDAGNEQQARQLYQSAVEQTEQAIAADARNPLPWYQQGMAQIGLDNYVAADSALARAEELRPIYRIETEGVRERAWIDMYGQAAPLVNAGQYEEAVEYFERANAIYQGRPEVMFTLGQIYMQLGEYEAAVENLRAAREIIESERFEEMDSTVQASWQESNAQIPTLIANALIASGDYEAAVTAVRGLLAEEPENLSYMRQLGSLYIEMERPDSARAIFDRMAGLNGLAARDYYDIGVGYYQLEDMEAAAEAFGRAAQMGTNDRDALEMWARSLQAAYPMGEDQPAAPAGALEDLQSAAERWLELDPANRNAYLIGAQTANRLDNQDRARELVTAIENLEMVVQNIQLQRYAEGGGILSGMVQNLTADQGSTVTLNFTLYGDGGGEIGSETVTVTLPAQDATQAFQVDIPTSVGEIAGYGYTVGM